MTAIRFTGAALIVAIGVVHLTQLSYTLDEQTYMGVLFILVAVGAAVVALGLLIRGGLAVWSLGAVIAACTLVGFVISSTVGLPGFEKTAWSAVGILSVALEGAFLALFAGVAARVGVRSSARASRISTPLAAGGPRFDR